MISEKENIKISKFLSLVLRHEPGKINITLDENGWTRVDLLLQQLNLNGLNITKEILAYVVSTNPKKRFSFNEEATMIRANQGHSVEVDLGYEAVQPPVILFHGTATSAIESILKDGLVKRSRHHVHLSTEIDTALNVGNRYGKPVLLKIAALDMFHDGFKFYMAANGVWLTDHVPAKYLSIIRHNS